MRGIKIITDAKRGTKLIQADIKEVSKNPQKFEELLDVLIAEERAGEKEYSLSQVKTKLKRLGKL